MRREWKIAACTPHKDSQWIFFLLLLLILCCCGGSKAEGGRERTGPASGSVPSCYLFLFFSSTQIQTQNVSKAALVKVIRGGVGSTDLFLLLFLP